MIARRKLLKSGAAAALAAPVLNSQAQQTVTLKFHTFMAPLSNVWLNMEEVSGRKVMTFDGIPVKRVDAILNTEQRVI